MVILQIQVVSFLKRLCIDGHFVNTSWFILEETVVEMDILQIQVVSFLKRLL